MKSGRPNPNTKSQKSGIPHGGGGMQYVIDGQHTMIAPTHCKGAKVSRPSGKYPKSK